MKIAIIGLGLIGGSMAIDLRKRNFASYIIGVDKDPVHCQTAKHIGLIDEISELEEAVMASDVIILATPADATRDLILQVLDLIEKQIVLDVCSTKLRIMETIEKHPNRASFVSTHPMAGTEFSGPWAAFSGLFDGKAVIFTDTARSSRLALGHARQLYDALGMRPVEMSSQDHDVHVAYISHMPHISSFALALTVLDKEKDEKNIFNLASGGFDSTVRLAKSNAAMWVPIFRQNRENLLEVIDAYMEKLQDFRAAIEQDSQEELRSMISEANRIRKVLS